MINEIKIISHMTENPVTIACHKSVQEASEIMKTHRFRHLPVLQGNQLVGILSQRDIALIEAIQSTDPARITVTEAMTPEPFVCAPEDALVDVASKMIQKHIGAAIVQKDGELVGIYTTQDALRSVIDFASK